MASSKSSAARRSTRALSEARQSAATSRKTLVSGPSPAGSDRRPLQQQYFRVGPQNPAGVTAIMRLADTGYMWQLCDLFEEYRNKDCHLQTVVSRRERALADTPWQVIPASEKRRDLKIAAWIEQILQTMGAEPVFGVNLRGFADTVIHLNAGTIYGYSAGEVPWTKEGKYIKPAGFLPMGQRRFVFSAFDASLRWFDVNGPAVIDGKSVSYPGLDPLTDYPAGRFLVHRPRINGAVGPREGLIRPLTWATMFRLWTVTDWHRAGEKAWKPYTVGKYKKNASVDEDRKAVEEALQFLTSMGFAALPDSVEYEIFYPKNRTAGDGGVHGGLANFLGAEMSKVTLGATLAVEQGRVGSNALGNVHEGVEGRIRDADARAMEETIQRQLIMPLVRYNFGDVELPTFRFITEEGADLGQLAIAIDKLAARGLQIPAKWTRTTFGIPEPDIGEELLSGGLRQDLVAVAAEAEKAKQQAEQAQQNAPAEKPQDGEDDTANDNAGDLPVSEKAVKAAHRSYVVHQILTAAGMRARPNYGRNTVTREIA
jgi:phage gp29-like protein